jgi:hypothetical protein
MILGLALFAIWPAYAQADFVFTASGTDTDGPVSATVNVAVSTNTITIQLIDTSGLNGSNVWSIGQAIADVGFDVSGLTGTASITGASGTLVNSDLSTDSLTLANNSWDINSSSSTSAIALGTIGWTYQGLAVGGAPPNELVANGTFESNWNSSLFTSSHAPDILTSVTFTINAPGVTSSSTITNLKVAFGTQPEIVLPGTPTPAPSSATLLGVCGLCLGGFWLRSRWRLAAAV